MYAQLINEETKQCNVGTGTNTEFYKSIGMTEMEVEQGYDNNWYVKGYAPSKPQSIINQERVVELKRLLQETDYQAIKFAEGWLSEEEYTPIREQREAYRNEIRSLENSK